MITKVRAKKAKLSTLLKTALLLLGFDFFRVIFEL